MPEITEVEKLRSQVVSAWLTRKIVKFSAPPGSSNPKKYAKDGWEGFSSHVRDQEITKVLRVGKNIWVGLDTEPRTAWHIHLGSTGWFLPGNEKAEEFYPPNDMYKNFIHSVGDHTIRVRVHLDDGQLWNYHDSRTWGTWRVREGDDPRDNEYFGGLGPDWLDESGMASIALLNSQKKGDTVQVLQDQHIAAGVGHYLANEILWLAKVHPLKKWNRVGHEKRIVVAQSVVRTIKMALKADDHRHWAVFQRKGKRCPECSTKIVRVARGSSQGDYLCPKCQRMH